MSQALVNEVKSLRARVEALERHITALEANLEAHYQRKRGPKPAIEPPVSATDAGVLT